MDIFLLLCLSFTCVQVVDTSVSYKLRLVSFSNPNGTAWPKLNYNHGQRRPCDNGGTDTCDTYFKICIKRSGSSGCLLSHDTRIFQNTNNITFNDTASWTGSTQSWNPKLLALINPLDKDSASTLGDLIDISTAPLTIVPGYSQSCPGDYTIVMTNHTSLTIQMTAWCNSGYTGPGCTYHYTGTNPYVSCQHGHLSLQCNNEEPVIVRYKPRTSVTTGLIRTFQGHIAAFLKQHICSTMQLSTKQSLWSTSRLGFTAKCGNKNVEPLVIQAALATEGYQDTGILRIVPTTLNNYHKGVVVAAIYAVKIQTYTNTDGSSTTTTTARKCCDCGSLPHCDTDTCDTHFRICVNNDPNSSGTGSCISTMVRPDTNQLNSCGDLRVNHFTNQLDIASTYISVTDTWTWNNTYIHVEVRDADHGDKYDVIETLTLKKDLTPGYWDLSNAASVSVLLQGHVRLSLSMLVWCGPNKYGRNCDVPCIVGGHKSCDPDTGATTCQSGYTGSDCHDINECKEHYCHGPGTRHCTNRQGSYQCSCNSGWTGINCSQDIDECQHNPCRNGGTCNNTVGSYTCACHGFIGHNCETDINECRSHNPCRHGGTCQNTRGSYTCICHGFTGSNCSQDIDECQHNPCQHGGTCNNTVGSYICSCHGYSGQNCEKDIDECTSVTCPHKNEHCVNNIGSYTCPCNTGWKGDQCNTDVDECEHNPCQHGGTCNNTIGSYTCQCNTGWTGDQCNTDVDECKHNPCQHGGTCHNTVGNYTCQCNTEWTGDQCNTDVDECKHNPCQHGGTCNNTVGSYICSCHGYNGQNCEKDIDECTSVTCPHKNEHCVNNIGSYTCPCNTGWKGDQCNTDVDECEHNPCQHGGTCNNTVGSYTCRCNTGWTGRTCSSDVNECHTVHDLCQNGGTCTNLPGTYKCTCTTGWKGVHCSSDINECDKNVCKNNATCTNTDGGFNCRCTAGWQGNTCDRDKNECHSSNPCHNGATCNNNPGSYRCVCGNGWSGPHCDVDIDECRQTNLCHHGSCVNTNGSYVCKCDNGWDGKNCSNDINECLTIQPCLNNGQCINKPGGYQCNCTNHWEGRNCSQDVDECTTQTPCQHGGSCTNYRGGFTCSCVNGWSGPHCHVDIDECRQINLCHHGSCVNTNGSYVCKCDNGWDGKTCSDDTNECLTIQPCLNNGQCINKPGGYQCNCTNHWEGRNCSQDVDECTTQTPCQHGGSCTNYRGGFTCSCVNGWSGPHCHVDIDECRQINLCHHGSCVNTNGSYVCKCDNGWDGKTCSDDTNECLTIYPCFNNGQCINTAGGYQCVCTAQWAGHDCSQDVDECKQPNLCHGSDVCFNYPGGFLCSHHIESSTTAQDRNSTSEYSQESYVSFISLECSANAWKVQINLPELYKRHLDFDPTDIYLGESGCQGYRSGDYLVIFQQYSDCRTHHSITPGSDVYTNSLVYAVRDANYKFIIRDFRFRIDVECNMAKNETVSQHFIETHNRVHTRNNNPCISGYGHYSILMTFYSDSSFLKQMTDISVMADNPLSADIEEDIYVKLTTSVTESDVKMRVESCYTLPSPGAGDHRKFYIIRNACAADVNTHVLDISPHETRLVFRDFVYATDQDNLYLYCTATFCNTTDYSSMCDQQCHRRSSRSVIAASGTYLYKATTSGVAHRSIGTRRIMVGQPDIEGASGRDQDINIHSILFVAALLVGMVVLAFSVVILISRGRLHLDKEQLT